MQLSDDFFPQNSDCGNCLCRTCANLLKTSVRCGNTEYFCRNKCGGKFAVMESCQSYKPKAQKNAEKNDSAVVKLTGL